jgi:hypothetical protein
MHPNFPLLGQPISAMLMALGVKPGISHLKSMRKGSPNKGGSTMELSSRLERSEINKQADLVDGHLDGL